MSKLRFLLLLIPMALAALAAPSNAQQIPLNEISRYLNAMTTAQGEFTQINPDGTISTGEILIKRPGRIRFEYNPPEQAMVMASGGQLAVFDPRSNDGPQRYPLSETPLNIILARNVDLARANMVTGHSSDGTSTSVRAQDPDHPEYGSIQLVFTASPTELRQWIVTDDTGSQTTVILGDLTKGGTLRDIEFNIRHATQNRQN